MSLVFKIGIIETTTTKRTKDFVVEAENEEKAIDRVKQEIKSSGLLDGCKPIIEIDVELGTEASDQIIYAIQLDGHEYFVECDLDGIKEKLDNEDE